MMHALTECIKAIHGMTGSVRNSQAVQDLQCIIDATQAHVQTNPHKFDKIITPDNIHNMQQVPMVQAPPSVHIPCTNDNRQIMHSMHCRQQFRGCPTIFLQLNSSACPLLQPPLNLAANPPHWLPSSPNTNTIISGKQHNCATPLLQPAQTHTYKLKHK
jgi:hypothetical protein